VIPTELVVRASSLREHYRALPTIRSAAASSPAAVRGRGRRVKTG
jgi:hypothetical protein